MPLPSPDAVYRVRASGPSLVHGIVDMSNAPHKMPPTVLVLVGNATPSPRHARMRLPIAGMYTIEALRLYDTFERDNHTRCIRQSVHAPELLARVLVPDTTSVSRSPHWFARMGTVDPETRRTFHLPAWTRIQWCGANRQTFDELHRSPLPTTQLSTASNVFPYVWARWRRGRLVTIRRPTAPFASPLCIVGGSHARNLATALNATHVKSVLVRLPLTSRLDGCSSVVLHYGQWDLSRNGAGKAPLEATLFPDIEHGLSARYAEVAGRDRVWVLPVTPIPLNCDVTTCPPTDWRSPPMIDEFNRLVHRTAKAYDLHVIDSAPVVEPMWDAASDYKHPHGVVLEALAILVHRTLLRSSRKGRGEFGS